MNEEAIALARILRRDSRYPLDAYLFVREALGFAADKLELLNCDCRENPAYDAESSGAEAEVDESSCTEASGAESSGAESIHRNCHVTGQQLCDGIRQYALSQFGLLSRTVLNSWGIHATSDFGEIVYNLIRVGILKKSPRDRRSHFDDVYDFEAAFERDFEIQPAFPVRRE